MKNVKRFCALLILLGTVFADEVQSAGGVGFASISLSFKDLLVKWGVSLGWIVVASIGFAFGVGVSIKVFDLLTKDINEWEEVKKMNWVVGMILTALIVMIGLIIIKIL
ncbi:MAG: hypothetical protein PHV30_09375 [Candidatus Margulisbacteria bacterium]|nr:hypothetical protein [Candidatus Margulisiibacteriota bacterium]